MIAFGAVVIAGSLQVGIGWGAEGPKSGFFPFYLGVAIIAASALNLVAAHAQEPDSRSSPTGRSSDRCCPVVIPTTIYVFAVPWTGIYVVADPDRLLHAMARPLQHRDVRSRSRSASRSRPI